MKHRLPGLPTISALMLAAILATWLCIVGPPNLKDWQTLTASCIALIGGALAYKGAMAKVNHDKDIADRIDRRTAVGIFMRLETSLRVLALKARQRIEQFERPLSGVALVEAKHLSIPTPEELSEAWSNLHLFPRRMAHQIANIRVALSNLQTFVISVEDTHNLKIEPSFQPLNKQSQTVLTNLENIEQIASKIGEWLEKEIGS